MELILASKNRHKAEEISAILGNGVRIITQADAGITVDVIEDGDSFEANAIKKATEIMNLTGKAVIADDSGLETDYLGGEPGIMTARYAGAGATNDENIDKLLSKLSGVPIHMRSARFVCVIALSVPNDDVMLFRGECEGRILTERSGAGGFGYDPVFYDMRYGRSFAQLEPHIKNIISHRAKALRKLAKYIL